MPRLTLLHWAMCTSSDNATKGYGASTHNATGRQVAPAFRYGAGGAATSIGLDGSAVHSCSEPM